MKLIKTCILYSITDKTLGQLIVIESPELSAVNFDEVLEIFKQTKNRKIMLWFTFFNKKEFCSELNYN